MTSREYFTNEIHNLEDMLNSDGTQPLKIFGIKPRKIPFPSNYRPKLYLSLVSCDTLMSRYLQLNGVLRWTVEFIRIDSIVKVSVLSQHQWKPREGYLSAVYRVFWYLKCNLKEISGRIVFDSKIPDIDKQLFHPIKNIVWEELYSDAEEEIPGNAPPPRVKPVYVGCYVDADHAGNLLTRRSHTGIIIFVTNSTIICYSKRQNIVESSSSDSNLNDRRIKV